MTICLTMIVKNEERTLPRLAESVRGQIDHWIILDTGSTDDTIATAEREFGTDCGEVFSSEWKGFGPSRNEAMELAEPHGDWLLWLDADETLGGTIETSDADWIECEERNGPLRFWKARMWRSGRGFGWTGMAHEYLSSPLAGAPARSRSFWVDHHGDGGSRADKFQRDLGLLRQEWDEDPTNARTAFYIARTYDDVGDLPQAIEWYRRRLTMGGWEQEIFYSRYRLGACLVAWGASEDGTGHLWSAWGMNRWRAEPLVALAEHYRQTEQWLLAWEAMQMAYTYCGAQPGNFMPNYDGLFTDVTSTMWRCAYEQSISAWWTGNIQRGKMLIDYLLGRTDVPEPYLSSVRSNLEFFSA